jgi:hypothetical protein
MKSQIAYALAHPVYDPDKEITRGHYWVATDHISACLTANIGME